MKLKPVDNWRYWYRKWSFWIIGLIPVISFAQLYLPEVESLFEPRTYTLIKAFLAMAGFAASQIKQHSIEVPPNPPVPEEIQAVKDAVQ